MKRQHGVTLVELLIVLVILAGLIAFAYPSYVKQVQKTKRAECEGVLLELATAMERDFSENNQYRDIITAGLFGDACPTDPGTTATYGLSIDSLTPATAPTSYRLVAAPSGTQTDDFCGQLTLSSTGVKTAAGGTVARCWR